ncbi:MAG: RecX family transcriptional regulator [Prevotella sp.]|nr:RecX family transcriptional regulator [Prevotella sp.]
MNDAIITEQQALQRLMALCARGEHSSGEMLDKMHRWNINDEAQAHIMQRLINERYVDDERFARAFVNDKIKYNQWGSRRIEQALWQKGIDKETRQAVLAEINDEQYLEVLRPLLKTKARSVKANSEYERQMKLARFAMGRGFTFNLIQQCLPEADNLE